MDAFDLVMTPPWNTSLDCCRLIEDSSESLESRISRSLELVRRVLEVSLAVGREFGVASRGEAAGVVSVLVQYQSPLNTPLLDEEAEAESLSFFGGPMLMQGNERRWEWKAV